MIKKELVVEKSKLKRIERYLGLALEIFIGIVFLLTLFKHVFMSTPFAEFMGSSAFLLALYTFYKFTEYKDRKIHEDKD